MPAPTGDVREAVPFFHVTDMAASLRFYVDGLGFRVAQTWEPDGAGKIRWCRIDRDAAGVMLQEYTADRRPAERLGVGVSVCFMCADALAVYRAARARGLEPAGEPYVGNGLWVAGYVDPDGYRVDFESPTEVAEDTTLSEWEQGRSADG